MDDIPLSNSTNELSLHICPSWSHVTTKYSNISNGINMSKSSRSAHANEMRNVAVGERNLPRLAQVTITTEFPITPIMNVIAWTLRYGIVSVQMDGQKADSNMSIICLDIFLFVSTECSSLFFVSFSDYKKSFEKKPMKAKKCSVDLSHHLFS
ncbi:hypothetical protein BLOT_000998 [Blomia tropicalis]|nr:hypothetical protein BLOT_000998 [Blomia tropicalis]